ncbi:MAG TPA: alpha/beta hydrolase [Stellaceae bacterium]|nr:alpha/beta hydrolase [Stellaceae bacterium]
MDTRSDGRSYEVTHEDVAYQQVGGKAMLARLYHPVGAAGAVPALVEVHGGAWTSGDRLNNSLIAAALARAGNVVLSLDFRMPPEAPYPDSIADINLGIRWLKAHAREFGANPDCVGGLATSSGGQQLMLAAMKPRDPRFAALPLAGAEAIDARLAFVILCWPVVDPLARYRMAQEKKIDRFLQAHHAFFGTEAAMAEGNPQLVLERGEPVERPPVLILQGTADDNLTPDMADRFAAAYRQAGGTAELHKFEGQPHMFVTKDPNTEAAQRALALMTAFVRSQASA